MSLTAEVKRALSAGTTENCRVLQVLEEISGPSARLPQDVGGWIRGRRDHDKLGDVFLLLGQDGFVHGLGEEGSPLEVSPQEGGVPMLLEQGSSFHQEESSGQLLVRQADDSASGVPLRRAYRIAGRTHPVISFQGDPYQEEFVLLRPRELPEHSFLPGQQRALFRKLSAPVSPVKDPKPPSSSSCCGSTSLLGSGNGAQASSSSGSLPLWGILLLGAVSALFVGGVLWLLHRHEKAGASKHR